MDAAQSLAAVAALRALYGSHKPRQIDIQSIHAQLIEAAHRAQLQAANIRTAGDCDELSATARGLMAQAQSMRAQIEREGAREDGSRAA